MSLPATIAKAIVDTVLARIALLFLSATAGDTEAARDAAIQMLAAYRPTDAEELTLAAEIVSLQFHALEALATAAEAGQSLNRVIRLRGSAVSLSRESHKARRRLDQIQRARLAGVTAPQAQATSEPSPAEPAPPSLGTEQALDLVATAQEAIRIAKKTGGKNWSQTLQKRLLTAQMTEKVKQQQARYAAQRAAQNDAAQNDGAQNEGAQNDGAQTGGAQTGGAQNGGAQNGGAQNGGATCAPARETLQSAA